MDLRSIAWANVKRHRGRAALMVIGMAVAVAAFVTVGSLVLSLQGTVSERLARYGASILVLPSDPELSLEYGGLSVAEAGSGEVSVMSDELVDTLRSLPSADRIAQVIPVLLEPVAIGSASYPAMGTDLKAALAAKPWWRVEGTLPRGQKEIVLGLDVRNRLGVDAGETVSIGGREYLVSGVLWETGGEEDGLILMDRGELADLAGREGEVNMLEVTAADSDAVEPLAEQISEAIPGTSVKSVRESLEFNAQADNALGKFGLAATALIVVVSAFIVSLTVLAAVRDRQREIGVLRALGYRRSHVWRLLLTESLVLSLGAAVFGTGVGLLGAVFGPRLVADLAVDFHPHPVIIAGGALLAVALAVVATLYPAARAARLDPALALRRV